MEGQLWAPTGVNGAHILPDGRFESCGSRAGAGAGPVKCSVCCCGQGLGWKVRTLSGQCSASSRKQHLQTSWELGGRQGHGESEGKVLDSFSITRAAAFIFVVVRSLFSDGTLTED